MLVKLRFALTLTGALSLSVAPVTPQEQAPRTKSVAWVVFVDDLNINFRDTGYLRTLVRTILTNLIQEADLVAIRAPGPSAVLTGFKRNRELITLVGELAGNSLKPNELMGEHRSMGLRETQYRTHMSLSSAIAAVAVLGQVDSQDRFLLYISNGHPFDMTTFPEARAFAKVAQQNAVKVVTIDASSLRTSPLSGTESNSLWEAHIETSRSSLRVLGEQSGGFVILDGGDMGVAVKRISESIRQ